MKNTLFPTLLLIILFATLNGCGGSSDPEPVPVVEPDPDPVIEPESPPEPQPVSSETLPRIDIYDVQGEIQNEPKIIAKMKVTDYIVGELPIVDTETYIGIEYRGSSSQYYYDKKSYGIETRDEQDEDRDVAILDFPEEEDWVLNGPFGDKTLIRNALMFDMAQGFGRYSSRYQFVELYINDEYHGLYVLMEKIKRDDNRLDINKLKEDENEGEDVTGGYILKLDKTTGEHPDNLSAEALYTEDISFISDYGTGVKGNNGKHHFIYHEPKPEDITEQQKSYIQNYVHDFETALHGENFKDEALGYHQFINVDSFVDYFIATEISGNVDGYRLSTFLYKDKNDKLSMGPLWDYNLAFGNADFCKYCETNMWIYQSEKESEGGAFSVPFWWYRLLEDDDFVLRLKARWSELRDTTLSDSAVETRIEEMTDYLKSTGTVERNFNRWDILGTYVWPNDYVGETYDDEVNYLHDWLIDRLQWLDSEIVNL